MPSNKIKVMVVDDSAAVRNLFSGILSSDPEIEIVATPADSAMTINLLKRGGKDKVAVDVITLDIKMPGIDGLSALPEIIKLSPDSKVIMVSPLTRIGAPETVKALSLGAAYCMTKPESDKPEEVYNFTNDLTKKIKELGSPAMEARLRKSNPGFMGISFLGRNNKEKPTFNLRKEAIGKPDIIAIGSSTGGPNALTKIFSCFKGMKFSVPIMITQHMPAEFTPILAKSLSDVSGLDCHEGKDGEEILPGIVYIAPGDFHMVVEKSGTKNLIRLNQNPPENFCRPAADTMLRSIAATYGSRTLVIILTGMGCDGLSGTRAIVSARGSVIAQDEKSSVVWGMPGSVANAGLCNAVKSIDDIAEILAELAGGK